MQPANPETSDRFDAALDAQLRAASARRAMPAAVVVHVDDRTLLALAAGRLPEDAVDAVDAHLVACVDCRDLLAELAWPVSESTLNAAASVFPAAPPAAAPRHTLVRMMGVVSVIGALAAAVLLAVGLGGPKQHPDFDWVAGFRAEPLVGGVQAIRTDAEKLPESLDFVAGGKLTWVIRAQDAAPASVVSVFVGPAKGALRRVDIAPTRGEDGTLALVAPAADLLGPAPGERLLVVAVGPEAIDLAGKTAAELDTAVDADDGVLFRKTLTYSVGSPTRP